MTLVFAGWVVLATWQPMLIAGQRTSMKMRRLSTENPIYYEGGLLGVKAEVKLFQQTEHALIKLRGIPLGGEISGIAWFRKDNFDVALEPKLALALKRRHVSIEGAGAFHDYSKMWVLIRLPLGLGRHTVSLDRKCD